MKTAVVAALLGMISATALASPINDPRFASMEAGPADPGCTSATLVSTGGPAPQNSHTLAVRWTGVSNFELVYNHKILLLDTFYDRGPNYPPLGFRAEDVKKADLILLGHGHFDHMSDAASVSRQTGAPIVAAPITVEKLRTQHVPESKIRKVTGRGGEVLTFDGFTVQPILALHGQPDPRLTEIMENALKLITPKMTPEQEAEDKLVVSRGTFDHRVIDEGTIAFLITFDDGFRVIYRDSGGKITDYERAAFADGRGTDLALVALSADYLNTLTEAQALEHAQLYRPSVFMPAHHDAEFSGHVPLARATEPVFEVLKAKLPGIVTASREYREPVCFDTERNISKK